MRIVFGTGDPYLNTHVARRFARLFPAAELDLIDNARHYVQVDEPERVAAAILNSDRVSCAHGRDIPDVSWQHGGALY